LLRRRWSNSSRVYDAAGFLDAVFLYRNRVELPFKLYLTDHEDLPLSPAGQGAEALLAA